jgi:DoxX-like family
MSTNAVSLEASRNGVLWGVQVLRAILFLIYRVAKLSGDEQMIQTFDAAGIRQWLRYVTALIEFASAILLLISSSIQQRFTSLMSRHTRQQFIDTNVTGTSAPAQSCYQVATPIPSLYICFL